MWLQETRAWLGKLDAALFHAINSGLAWRPLDYVMWAATTLGTGLFQSGLCLLLIAAGAVKESAGLRRAGYAGLIALTASGFLVQIAKHLWDRPRPVLAMYDVRIVGDPLFAHSFPSGHTMTAFSVMVALAIVLPRLRYVLIPIAALTGVSRVYMGVHYPLDVVYGAALGAFTGWASARLIVRQTGRPKPETSAPARIDVDTPDSRPLE